MEKVSDNMNSLVITVAKSPQEAPNYREDHPGIKSASLTQCIVVRNGTKEGRPTVDLIFTDEDGKKHVALITGRLMKSLSEVIEANGG